MLESFLNVSGLWPATLLKETPIKVFSCGICEIFRNTCFEEHLRTAAFAQGGFNWIELVKRFSEQLFSKFLWKFVSEKRLGSLPSKI